jgi:hypothetical protein
MADALNLPPCADCGGRRYTRTPRGWSPCLSCYVSLANATYIKPQVKEGEVETPDLRTEPWGLSDRVETGDYTAFRHQVWRSLLHFYSRRLSYEYVEGWRLVEIQFQRDPEFTSVRQLKDPELVVLVMGLADPHHDFTPAIAKNLVNLRKMYGVPTWVFQRTHAKALPERRTAAPLSGNVLADGTKI